MEKLNKSTDVSASESADNVQCTTVNSTAGKNRSNPSVSNKENKPSSGGWWLSTRRVKEYLRCPEDFILKPTNDGQGTKRKRPPNSDPPAPPEKAARLVPFKEKRYCCDQCKKWYSASEDLYGTTDRHLQFTGRHKQPPRAPTPPSVWDISFTDSEDD